MKRLALKSMVREMLKEELNEVNWKALGAAGLIGFVGLHHPAGKQAFSENSPTLKG